MQAVRIGCQGDADAYDCAECPDDSSENRFNTVDVGGVNRYYFLGERRWLSQQSTTTVAHKPANLSISIMACSIAGSKERSRT